MQTVAEILETLGGARKAADALSTPEPTVWSWRQRNRIPAKHWNSIIKASNGRVKAAHLLALMGRSGGDGRAA